jgi:hypothetical protein
MPPPMNNQRPKSRRDGRHGAAGKPPRTQPSLKTRTARVLKKIQDLPGLSEDEKILFARSLAATPDERWQLHENFLRSHGLFRRSDRKKYGFK